MSSDITVIYHQHEGVWQSLDFTHQQLCCNAFNVCLESVS